MQKYKLTTLPALFLAIFQKVIASFFNGGIKVQWLLEVIQPTMGLQ